MLAAAGSLADAAEAHGSLCGALCSMAPYSMQDWINEILPDGAALSEESAAMLERVFTATATSFGEQGMEFEPLLPDDEQPLNGRANALALWCTGFLYGLGTGQISDLEALERRCRRNRPRLHRDLAGHGRRCRGGRIERTGLCRTGRIHPGRRPGGVRGTSAAAPAGLSDRPAAAALSRLRWIARSSRAAAASSCA